MINLLRAEFFKVRKSKSVYICTVVMIAFTLFSYGMFAMLESIQQEMVDSGLIMEEDMSFLGVHNILAVVQEVFVESGVIIVTVFAAIFVIGEYRRGAIKNIAGKGYSRWKIFLVKYTVTTITVLAMMIITEIAAVLFGLLIVGTDGINGEFWKNFFQYSGIELLLSAALIGVVILICELTRNMGAGISIGICIIIFSTLLTSGLDLIFHKAEFNVSDYWIMDLITNCPLTDIDSSFAVRAVISAVVWMAAVFGMGLLHFRKADIK